MALLAMSTEASMTYRERIFSMDALLKLQKKYSDLANYYGGMSVYAGCRPDAGKKDLIPYYQKKANEYNMLFIGITKEIIKLTKT